MLQALGRFLHADNTTCRIYSLAWSIFLVFPNDLNGIHILTELRILFYFFMLIHESSRNLLELKNRQSYHGDTALVSQDRLGSNTISVLCLISIQVNC